MRNYLLFTIICGAKSLIPQHILTDFTSMGQVCQGCLGVRNTELMYYQYMFFRNGMNTIHPGLFSIQSGLKSFQGG